MCFLVVANVTMHVFLVVCCHSLEPPDHFLLANELLVVHTTLLQTVECVEECFHHLRDESVLSSHYGVHLFYGGLLLLLELLLGLVQFLLVPGELGGLVATLLLPPVQQVDPLHLQLIDLLYIVAVLLPVGLLTSQGLLETLHLAVVLLQGRVYLLHSGQVLGMEALLLLELDRQFRGQLEETRLGGQTEHRLETVLQSLLNPAAL